MSGEAAGASLRPPGHRWEGQLRGRLMPEAPEGDQQAASALCVLPSTANKQLLSWGSRARPLFLYGALSFLFPCAGSWEAAGLCLAGEAPGAAPRGSAGSRFSSLLPLLWPRRGLGEPLPLGYWQWFKSPWIRTHLKTDPTSLFCRNSPVDVEKAQTAPLVLAAVLYRWFGTDRGGQNALIH